MYCGTKQNVAYDYDLLLFDDSKRETNIKYDKTPKVNLKTKTKAHLSFSMAVVMIAFILALVSILYSYAQLTETSAVINKLKKDVSAAQNVEKRLLLDIEKKTSLKSIEEYAKNQMGMVPLQTYQVEYIKIKNSDRAEVIKKESTFSADAIVENVVRSFNAVLEYLK